MSSEPVDAAPERGVLFIISAPSGAGKSTLVEYLRGCVEGIEYSISTTTRPLRRGEQEGREYHYTSIENFERLLSENEFIEHAKVHGNYYGTRKSTIESALNRGDDLLLDIDVQGAAQIREHYPKAVSIFIMPPSLEVLEDRLRNRGTDDDTIIRERLANARAELSEAKNYDYVVVNDDITQARNEIVTIVKTERKKRGR